MSEGGGSQLTVLGVLASIVLIGGLVCVGVVVAVLPGFGTLVPDVSDAPVGRGPDPVADAEPTAALELVGAESEVPRIDAAAAYVVKDNVVEVELSEYAGYSGLIVANGGLAPNPDSWFAKNAGFQVKLTVSEEDAWSRLNAGKLAATVTTADVLPLYGRQLSAVVPAQIGYSRGADGIVVRSDVKRINDLRGKVLVAQQFGESEFFLRYLAQEAGIPVVTSDEPKAADPNAITVVFAEDAFAAGDAFLADLGGGGSLAGAVTWDPKTTEVAEASGGKAHVLVTNRNLLVIADVLLVNKGFADEHPAMVKGLVEGLLVGNDLVRSHPEEHLATIAKAFSWTPADAKDELAKVHLSNLPENLQFFRSPIDMAGSFPGIYQTSVLAYGREIVRDVAPPDRFVSLAHLEALEKEGKFAGQQVAIAPIKTGGAGSVETDPLLSKDIRFFFEPNSSKLDMKEKKNLDNLKSLHRLLDVSPGSTILVRGHVDGGRKADFQKQGGDRFVREMALKAITLSTERAKEVEDRLVEVEKVDEKRIEAVGVGWEEPVSQTDPDQNRRVEAQWFTLE